MLNDLQSINLSTNLKDVFMYCQGLHDFLIGLSFLYKEILPPVKHTVPKYLPPVKNSVQGHASKFK